KVRAHIAPESDAEQCIDDDLAAGEVLRGEGAHRATARAQVLVGLTRIAVQLLRVAGGEHAHGEPGGLSEARQHVAITAVVAVAAHDHDAMGHRPARAQVAQRRFPGTLHQGVAGYAQRLDGMRIEGTHLRSRIHSHRQRHGAHYTVRCGHAMTQLSSTELAALKSQFQARARALGFSALGVAGIEIPQDERHLLRWLDAGFHGEMGYMQRHGSRRSRPQELQPGPVRVLSARMDYWPADAQPAQSVLADPTVAYVSRYALGRDYHKVLRRSLAALASAIQAESGPFGYRVCVDTAPVLERAHARDAGLGWIGKHTNLIARDAGSWFFLGEILTDLPLPEDAPASAHCGSCQACLPACPTGAIVAPWRLDARRCISYLTIEHPGSIPLELRAALGNRVYGCD